MKITLFRHSKYLRSIVTLIVLCGVLSTGALIAQMIFLSEIVSRVFLTHTSFAHAVPLILFLLTALVIRAAFVWGREMIAQQGAIRLKTELRECLFQHLLQLGPAFSRGERTGELVAAANEGIERLDAYVSRYLPQIVLSVLIPLLIVAVILPLDVTSAVLLLVTGPIIPLLMIMVGSYAEKHIQQQWSALTRMSAHLLDSIQGLTTLKLFGRSKAEHTRIASISENFREKTMKVLRYAFLSGAVLEFITAMAIGLVAVVLGVRLLNNGISFESAFLVLLLTPEFYRPLQDLGVHRHAGMEGKASAQRILELLETPLPTRPNVSTPSARLDRELTLTLTEVTYTYPGSAVPALKGVSLTLPARTCTALIGRSGAGKSTLVNLLLRFIDYEGGTISVNSIPLKELPVELWREYVALVPQHPYLFYGSVRENIQLARPEASDDEVREAAELAGARDFIEQLPQGFDTQIGEQGLRLSAGQAQRLALARAFLKDAPLLILDEPTSSLDPESELLIRQAIERLVHDRTVLVIAHRYNTIAHAQQVAVMEEGRILSIGGAEILGHGEDMYAQLMQVARKG
jgi:ATP-binding cassette subfamily C protein CydD